MYSGKTKLQNFKSFMLFAFIPLLAFLLVVFIPFIFGLLVTLTDWTGLKDTFNFLGFQNYVTAFTDPQFWTAMSVTLKYVLIVLVGTQILAVGMALLVTGGLKGQNFFRASYFVPNLIGGVILGFVWSFIFSRVLPYVGKSIGNATLAKSWLGNANLALYTLIIVGIWQYSGYMMLIYIAGFLAVPADVLEAAQIDGANARQIFFKIKVPLIVPSMTISLFLTLQKAFMTFDINLSLTGGDPYRQTELVAMHIYNEAFTYQQYGTGQAKAILFFLIVAAITLTQVGLLKSKEVEA
jgi:raffinose/stachyose/melibiose transport system permease protein